MFLNPLMLAGLSAVSIPIIIHLLNRRKFERVVWAAMRFVRLSVEKNQRRIKVEDMLLLILRCLLLALLAIALARPVLRAAVGGLGLSKVTAVVVLDNSYSMTQTDGVEPKFEAAKRAADEVIKTMPTGSSVAVLLCSDVVNKLIPEPTYDLTLASEQIKDAPVFDRGTNLLSGIQSAMEILKDRPELRKEIYVITDGQASGWGRMEEIRRVLEGNHREVRAHLLFVGRPEEKNLGIASLKLDGGVVAVNVPVRLNVRVQNFGKADANDVNVNISVDGEPPMDQTTIASIPGGESRSVSLFARMKADGFHTVTAKIDGDHLPADDWRTVALRAVKEVKVLLIDGDPGREARESETFFLRNALRPVPRAQWDDYFVKLTVKTPTELEGTRFEDFDAVMSANVTDFSASALGQLITYVKGGGGLVVFLGDNINVNFYNEQLFKKYGLLPAGLGQARGDAKAQEQWFNLADKGYDHPIVSIWKDPNAGSLSSVRFFRAFDLLADDAAKKDEARVVLRFADQKPAMMERDFGQGRVVLFASTADTDWNDLGARAGTFVPLMLRTLGHLVARQDEHLTIMAGQEFSHAPPVEFLNKDAIISKPPRHFSSQTKDEVHEAKRVELVNGAPFVQFAGTDFAGAYEIKVEGSAPIRFAVQGDSSDSNLDALNENQYSQLGEVADVVKWLPGAALEETLEKGRVGAEFWLPLALAAAVLGTMETLLAHWFSKSK